MQELEFNVAFLQEMSKQTQLEIDQWKTVDLTPAAVENSSTWNDPEKRPSNVVTMVAWSKHLLDLFENRIQQNKLKQKELIESEKFPAEWAVLRFQQGQILMKMQNINHLKTQTAIHDLKDRLLGFQNDFDTHSNRKLMKPAKSCSSKKTKKVSGKVNPLPVRISLIKCFDLSRSHLRKFYLKYRYFIKRLFRLKSPRIAQNHGQMG